MSEPFLSEIRIMSFVYAPKGWAQCNGQFLPINQNQALFALIGTTFGGNGQTTFALPDMRGRVPVHVGQGFTSGQAGGEASHTVTASEMPAHVHAVMASGSIGNSPFPRLSNVGHVFARDPGNAYAGGAQNLTALAPSSVSNLGGSQPHNNMQPFLVLNFCIALQGIFPSQS